MMKAAILSSLIGLGCCLSSDTAHAQKPSTTTSKDHYNIRVKLDNYPNDTLIMGYRLGKQTYVKDSCIGRNDKGEFVFNKKDTLEGGVYLMLLKPSNNYFEFLIANETDQRNMHIYNKIEGGDLTKHLKIEGSEDNKIFLDYLHFLGSMRDKSEKFTKEREQLVKQKEEAKGNASKEAEAQKKIDDIDKVMSGFNDEVTAHQKTMRDKHPKSLSVNLIRASNNPVVPKEIQEDQDKAYRYYKAHYFDELDWSDARLIRTPILEEKIEFYLEKLTIQIPDSIIVECEYLMNSAKKGGNKDMIQYVSSHMLNKYAKSQIICMDAVYVYLGEKYYCGANKPDWVEADQLEKICDNVAELKPLRCGQPALEIVAKNIQDSTQFKFSSLVGKKRFYVLFFWDPSCGNCGKASAKLAPIYNRFKPFGLEVIGVCSKEWKEAHECRKSAAEKGMKWINLSDDAYPLAVIKKQYAIKMNPYIYFYDKDMKLIYKRLDPEQVGEILEREFKQMVKDPAKNGLTAAEVQALEKAFKEIEEEKLKNKDKKEEGSH